MVSFKSWSISMGPKDRCNGGTVLTTTFKQLSQVCFLANSLSFIVLSADRLVTMLIQDGSKEG